MIRKNSASSMPVDPRWNVLRRPLHLIVLRTVFVAGWILIAGCSSDSDARFKSLSHSDADALSAQRSRFDATEDPPFTAQTHFAAGQLAESQSAAAIAISHYDAAIKLDPDHLPSLYRLGVLHAQAQRWPEAIAVWERYIQASDGDPAGYSNLGFCYDLSSQPDPAEAAYKKGIARDANHSACRVNYGLMLARLGRTDEAMAQMRTVLPEAQAWYNLGSLYEQLGRKDDARTAYRKALQLNAGDAAAAQRLAGIDTP